MHIESLKTWHWIIIGALIGLGIAAVRTHTPTSVDARAGLALAQFADLASAPYNAKSPALRDLAIFPAADGRNFVTGEYRRPTGFFSAPQYVPFQLNTPVPFRLPYAPTAPSPAYTVRDFLAATNPSLPYNYVWYASDSAQYLVCTAGGVLLIGGLWPVVLRLLIGAGFGRKTPPEPAYDLDRFARTDEAPAARSAQPSAENAAQLQTLTQTLESQLAATAAGGSPNLADSQQPAAAIATLSDAPYEPDPTTDPSDRPKDYKGEFYPVARSGQKNAD